MGTPSYSASISDTDALSATVSDGVQEGTYHVTVRDIGSLPLAVSADPPVSSPDSYAVTRVTDPTTTNLSTAGTYSLTIGTGTPISLTATTLQGLADQINSKAGTQVAATVVNIGSSDGRPDYRLSIQGRSYGALAFSLKGNRADASQFEVLAAVQKEAGKPVSYSVNGAPAASSNSRTVTLAPGLSLTLKKADLANDVSIAVTRGSTSVKDALNNFASAYNAAVDELDKNTGSNSGSLKGDSIIASLSHSLADIATWSSGSGTTTSFFSMGLELDKAGKLTLDDTKFAAATANGMDGITSFLGGAGTGGLLKVASDTLDSILHTDSGVLKSAETIITASSKALNDRISDEQTRIDTLQTSLAAQMSVADAMIAQMEQQATYYTNMFAAMQTSSNSMK
jgi:flagellar hook-associated protein 2